MCVRLVVWEVEAAPWPTLALSLDRIPIIPMGAILPLLRAPFREASQRTGRLASFISDAIPRIRNEVHLLYYAPLYCSATMLKIKAERVAHLRRGGKHFCKACWSCKPSKCFWNLQKVNSLCDMAATVNTKQECPQGSIALNVHASISIWVMPPQSNFFQKNNDCVLESAFKIIENWEWRDGGVLYTSLVELFALCNVTAIHTAKTLLAGHLSCPKSVCLTVFLYQILFNEQVFWGICWIGILETVPPTA